MAGKRATPGQSNPSSGARQKARGVRGYSAPVDKHAAAMDRAGDDREYVLRQIARRADTAKGKRDHAASLQAAAAHRPKPPNPAGEDLQCHACGGESDTGHNYCSGCSADLYPDEYAAEVAGKAAAKRQTWRYMVRDRAGKTVCETTTLAEAQREARKCGGTAHKLLSVAEGKRNPSSNTKRKAMPAKPAKTATIPQPGELRSLEALAAYLNLLARKGLLMAVYQTEKDAEFFGTETSDIVAAHVNGPCVQLETVEFVEKLKGKK